MLIQKFKRLSFRMDKHISLRIESIRDMSFQIDSNYEVSPSQLGIKVEEKEMVAYGDSKTVAVTTLVEFAHDYDADHVRTVLSYTNEIIFYVENFSEVFRLENNKYIFDRTLLLFLFDVIIPTIRGILYSKTAGTGLAKCYLPLINSKQVILNSLSSATV